MDYEYDKEVGQRIRQSRRQLGLTQDQLAARLQVSGCDMTRSTVAKIESGQRHIYLYEIKAIQKILKLSFNELLC